jgi:hypothetical protein
VGGIARRLNTACDIFADDANQFTDRRRGLRPYPQDREW